MPSERSMERARELVPCGCHDVEQTLGGLLKDGSHMPNCPWADVGEDIAAALDEQHVRTVEACIAAVYQEREWVMGEYMPDEGDTPENDEPKIGKIAVRKFARIATAYAAERGVIGCEEIRDGEPS